MVLCRASNKVPYQCLFLKLKAFGIRDKVFDWIENFLSSRKQRVAVRGFYSDWTDVISGVLQGSVLEPTLFIMLMTCQKTWSFLGLFADDTKIFCPITSPIDINLLQQDLNSLLNWCGTYLSSLLNVNIWRSVANSQHVIDTIFIQTMKHTIFVLFKRRKIWVSPFDEHSHFNAHIKQVIYNVLVNTRWSFNSRDADAIRLLYTIWSILVHPQYDGICTELESSVNETPWYPRYTT